MQLAANIISFIGGLLMLLVGILKRKDHMLYAQSVQFTLQSIAQFLVGSITAGISNLIGIIRIFVFTHTRVTAWLKLGFILLQALLSWLAGADTLLEWLPVLAMVAYTWYLDTEDAILFKAVNLLGSSLWLVHDISYGLYSLVIFDVLTIISLILGMLMLVYDRYKKAGKKGVAEIEEEG